MKTLNRIPLLKTVILVIATITTALLAENKETITHSFLGVGKANQVVIVGEDGKVQWRYGAPASDGWVLPNGNVLLALYGTKDFPHGGVAEIDRKTKKIAWSYKGQQKETSTVQPLPGGKFLVAELGPQPRALIINRKGEVLKTTPLQCQKKNAHMQTRMLRMLPNGNYIAPHLLDFAVKEYDPDTGKVLRSFPTDDRGRAKRDWPFTAIRLADGNTLIGCTNGNRIIEVDAKDAVDALRFFGALRREPGPQTQHLLITFGQQAHTLTSGISQGGVFLLFLVEAHVESLQFRHRV